MSSFVINELQSSRITLTLARSPECISYHDIRTRATPCWPIIDVSMQREFTPRTLSLQVPRPWSPAGASHEERCLAAGGGLRYSLLDPGGDGLRACTELDRRGKSLVRELAMANRISNRGIFPGESLTTCDSPQLDPDPT